MACLPVFGFITGALAIALTCFFETSPCLCICLAFLSSFVILLMADQTWDVREPLRQLLIGL